VYRCFQVGAVATGCELTIEPESKPYAEFRTDERLLDAYIRRASGIGRRFAAVRGYLGIGRPVFVHQ
jgi:hypothetical protein